MKSRIIGTGSSSPSNIVSNDDLSKLVDTNDEWIRSRTGIERRHIADKDDADACAGYASDAARKALDNAGLTADKIDMIIVATSSADAVYPNMASLVQKEINAVNAAGYDLNAACSGFLFGLDTADAFIRAGIFNNILVIGAEIMSRRINWEDRSTCILFGDGAGAVVVSCDADCGIEGMLLGGDGMRGEALTCTERSHVVMNGREIFEFAVKKVPETIVNVIDKCGWNADEVEHFVLHQANMRIIQSVARRLNIDIERFPANLMEYGNTSSASIPILLDELNRGGLLHRRERMVIAGFGAGLSWGATALTW